MYYVQYMCKYFLGIIFSLEVSWCLLFVLFCVFWHNNAGKSLEPAVYICKLLNLLRRDQLSQLLDNGGPAAVLKNRQKTNIPRLRLLEVYRRLVGPNLQNTATITNIINYIPSINNDFYLEFNNCIMYL